MVTKFDIGDEVFVVRDHMGTMTMLKCDACGGIGKIHGTFTSNGNCEEMTILCNKCNGKGTYYWPLPLIEELTISGVRFSSAFGKVKEELFFEKNGVTICEDAENAFETRDEAEICYQKRVEEYGKHAKRVLFKGRDAQD